MISEDDFRAEAAAFLHANAQPNVAASTAWGVGSDRVDLLGGHSPEEERSQLAAAKSWRETCFDNGFGWITGPTRYGGRGLAPGYEELWQQLEAGYITPDAGPFAIGLRSIAPTILAHGTDTVKDRYLRRLYRGELLACQLFSEPDAGSDLANLQTRADRDGDEWILTGQKVWSSGAQYSDLGEAICRTDPKGPKHKSLTAFLVDMRAPGVEVRPLRQMNGAASFNEVFLDGVRVSDDHRLGPVNDGWAVAITTMMSERGATGTEGLGGGVSFERLAETLRQVGGSADASLRQSLADIYIHGEVARLTNLRAVDSSRRDRGPGPEGALAKLAMSRNMERISRFLSAALGVSLVCDAGQWGTYAWSELTLTVPGFRIGGGTDEIQKNAMSERILGLPKDTR